VCTYQTISAEITGSGKSTRGWFPLQTASVYYDHPVHALADHTLNIDLLNPALGPEARVAVELEASSARALAEAIIEALDSVPAELLAQSAH
jgi:hypothetical protein